MGRARSTLKPTGMGLEGDRVERRSMAVVERTTNQTNAREARSLDQMARQREELRLPLFGIELDVPSSRQRHMEELRHEVWTFHDKQM